jgi:sugar-specific transcriptional regulator TrmB
MIYSDVERGLIDELKKLGLSENQAILLLFIMTHGNSPVSEILRHTGFSQEEVRQDLRRLISLEVVVEMKDSEQYYALPIQEVLDLLIDRKKKQV